MDKRELDRHITQSDEEAHPGWFQEHPDDQQLLTFPPQVHAFLSGNYRETESITLPLFKELSAEEEAEYRKHARENYMPGTAISTVFHPVWQDEARQMNDELDAR